ncbi:methyltransferase [Thermococcus guaymasensis DSM 11113]|uniref:Methyltransferase n=1 Tax=Thermococcus guaymasensis DSM 11113 TaxID=1432656 RepID=A0A0X1KMA7_9EURY|nr:DUF3216 domain-containing protein [Thermococcus guaymasensis]AJC72397.1 methyltransferase [Thermococcus guaymasensis DSM 11113]
MVEVPEVEEVKSLLRELGEEDLIRVVDSFVALNTGLESKKGKEFIEVSVLGFLEGILTALKSKVDDPRVGELYEKVRKRRAELDEMFRKPRIPYLEG